MLTLAVSITSGSSSKHQINHKKGKRVAITTYGPGYHGRRTASGEIYDKYKMTVAVPVKRVGSRRFPVIPFGSTLKLQYGGRLVYARVNDLCPAGTYDLSDAAMKALLGKYSNTKVYGIIHTIVKNNKGRTHT